MVEVPSADKQLRFRHVTVHGDGQKLNGTLYLHKHHLSFSYYADAPQRQSRHASTTINGPESDATNARTSTEASARSGPSTASINSEPLRNAKSSASTSQGSVNDTSSHSSDQQSRQRPRELWVPYPMINSCILRPSHAPISSTRPRDESGHAVDGEDDLFPPTFGTATYGRPSSDSARLAPYSSPSRSNSPGRLSSDVAQPSDSGRQPAIRIRCRDFKMMAFHFHETNTGSPADEVARQVFYVLRNRGCVNKIEDVHAFHYRPQDEERNEFRIDYDARREYARLGISGKAADGPGAAWRISDINHDYSYCATYPKVLSVPKAVSDNMLKYGAAYRSRCRIPCLTYLHSNGGSISRSAQPMVGLQNKRSPQDERLVSAIFSSHIASLQSPDDSPHNSSTTSLPGSEFAAADNSTLASSDSLSEAKVDMQDDEKSRIPQKKIYGSTRRNLIVDARPKVNAYMNRAGGGGVEDASNYSGNENMPVELVYLNIANIHVMRKSLEKVVDSFANSDYIKFKPSEELLRNSGWLNHIANMIEGTEMVARAVGLGGSHILLHCSDGWDRTAQVSALAQIMLDPQYRTLEGFITLVQKDFLSFGHKFRERDGIEGCEKWYEIENERIAPRDGNSSDPNGLNKFSTKALSGARNWIEKNRNTLFRQQNSSKDSLGDRSPARSSSPPPPNPIIHSSPTSTSKDEKKHKVNENEISPVFHQFLDVVYQLMYHYEDAFEFNERFLRRLFWHAYSCQYGEFLFNNEQERSEYQGKLPSVWPYFLSRRKEFTNPNYTAEPNDPLLFPKRRGSDREVEVRWWHNLYGRKDEEMNVSRALAPADPSTVTPTRGASISIDEQDDVDDGSGTASVNGSIKEAKSTPNLTSLTESITKGFSSLGLQKKEERSASLAPQPTELPPSNAEDALKQTEVVQEQPESRQEPEAAIQSKTEQLEYDGDPLGVTSRQSSKTERGGLDFAAFASQNAFRDR